MITNTTKERLASEAIAKINNACKLRDVEFLGLAKDIQELLIECYRQGFIAGLEEVRGK